VTPGDKKARPHVRPVTHKVLPVVARGYPHGEIVLDQDGQFRVKAFDFQGQVSFPALEDAAAALDVHLDAWRTREQNVEYHDVLILPRPHQSYRLDPSVNAGGVLFVTPRAATVAIRGEEVLGRVRFRDRSLKTLEHLGREDEGKALGDYLKRNRMVPYDAALERRWETLTLSLGRLIGKVATDSSTAGVTDDLMARVLEAERVVTATPQNPHRQS